MTRSIIRGTYVVLRGGWGCAGGVDVAVLLKFWEGVGSLESSCRCTTSHDLLTHSSYLGIQVPRQVS